MSIISEIKSGEGGSILRVYKEGEIGVVMHDHPPPNEQVVSFPYQQFFTDDGTSTGSSDMTVNGGTTPVEFWIASDSIGKEDIYIKTVVIRVGDASATLNKFGGITALTNGVDFEHTTESGTTSITNGNSIKTNLDFIMLSGGNPAFGSGQDAFKADISGAGADTYLPVIDFARQFGKIRGLLLRAGTKDKLLFRVNDNLTAVDTFQIVGYGTRFTIEG